MFTEAHPVSDQSRRAELRFAFFGQPVDEELYPHILGMLDEELTEQLRRAEQMMVFMPSLEPERALAIAAAHHARRLARLAA